MMTLGEKREFPIGSEVRVRGYGRGRILRIRKYWALAKYTVQIGSTEQVVVRECDIWPVKERLMEKERSTLMESIRKAARDGLAKRRDKMQGEIMQAEEERLQSASSCLTTAQLEELEQIAIEVGLRD